jgi:hypothetical protein
MSATWARIEGAVFIPADRAETGYHTYVAVPAPLAQAVVSRYELVQVKGENPLTPAEAARQRRLREHLTTIGIELNKAHLSVFKESAQIRIGDRAFERELADIQEAIDGLLVRVRILTPDGEEKQR